MKKIFMNVKMVEEIISSKRGKIDSNMILNLSNKKEYKLDIAVKFNHLNNCKDNSEFILTLDELKLRNYKLYSSIGFSKSKFILKSNNLFDDEVDANGITYKVDVGYLGRLLPLDDNINLEKPVNLTPIFKLEHSNIKKEIKLLNNEIDLEEVNFHNVNKVLNNLFDMISNHTERENLFLYPEKFNYSKLETVNKQKRKFMETISNAFLNYYNKWEDSINLNNFPDFKLETKDICKKLLKRMAIEENEIFICYS